MYRQVSRLASTDAAYIAGLVDGEGTVTLARKHAGDQRHLVVSIANTEADILDHVLAVTGAGKITRKRTAKSHHTPSFAYALWNRQALSLLLQIEPFMHSYKRQRARMAIAEYVRLTPRNGKYTAAVLGERKLFEDRLLAVRPAATKPMDTAAALP